MLRYRVVLALLPLAACAQVGRADSITSFMGDGNPAHTGVVGEGFSGQSFTTPGGGPWKNITFNFVSYPGGGSFAQGTITLLDQVYAGAPGDLDSSTAGYVGTAVAVGNVYSFDSGVQLSGNTQYFIYVSGDSGINAIEVEFPGSYAGGNYFYSPDNGTAYSPSEAGGGGNFLDADLNQVPAGTPGDAFFQLSGDLVSDGLVAPLPGTTKLGGAMLALMGLGWWARGGRRSGEKRVV
ncbi:MAG TPA: hypothetical protein VHM90_07990 [Phycisphaerae bacterium]|nr:hypothetical protein [Phycisphaerae bacterium]